MKIVVDTNIVFSAILNSTSRIGQILITSKTNFQFYSCVFLKTELAKHQKKLLKLTKLTSEELEELQQLIQGRFRAQSGVDFDREFLQTKKIPLPAP